MKKFLFLAASAMMILAGCSKEVASLEEQNPSTGIYAIFTNPTLGEWPATKALSNTGEFSWIEKEKIDVFPETPGEQMIYTVTPDSENGKLCQFKVSSFEMLDGTYYSLYPTTGAVDDCSSMTVSFLGQTQDGDNNTDHIASYYYSTSSAEIASNAGGFTYTTLVSTLKLPLIFADACTVSQVVFSVPEAVLAKTATVNVKAGTLAPAEMTDALTIDLKEPISVSAGSTLTVYLVAAPFTVPGSLTVTANCEDGSVFSVTRNNMSPSLAANQFISIGKLNMAPVSDPDATVNAVKYEKVTSLADVEAGDYVLVCKNGSEYDAFSFNKLMENAEAAASLVSGCADLSAVIGMSSSVSSKLEGNNFVALTDTRNTDTELYIPEDFTGSVISMTGDYVEGAATLTTTDGKYSLGLDKISVALGSGNSAEISAAFNAEDIKTILAALNWKCYDATFGDLVRYVASESNMTQAQLDNALAVFDIAAVVAKETFAEKNMGTLMDITTSTKMIDVFAKYYDNFVVLSKLYKDKDLGLAKPFGFNAATNGFSFSVPAPESVWFTRLQNSLSAAVAAENGSTDAAAWAAAKTSFVNYWKDYDADFQVGDFTAFFSGIARKATDALTIEQFNILAGMDWSKVAALYDARTAEMTKTLASVSLYKKAE